VTTGARHRRLGLRVWLEALVLFALPTEAAILVYGGGAEPWVAFAWVGLGVWAAAWHVARARMYWTEPLLPARAALPDAEAASEEDPPGDALADAWESPAQELRALGYVRLGRDVKGPEFEAQAEAIAAWCRAHGLALDKIVRDVEAETGDARPRPGLSWALERVAAGEAEALVAARLSDLATSAANLPPMLRWFQDRRLTLVAVDMRLDTSTEAGRLAVDALAAVGGWERHRLSERTRRGLAAARSQGAGRGRATLADLPELRSRIASMRDRGMTLQAIADVLNDEGVPTVRGGAKWRPSSVQSATGYRRPSSPSESAWLPSRAQRD
jgi:DNA invertase Pin-like site-specific DNA recombinase